MRRENRPRDEGGAAEPRPGRHVGEVDHPAPVRAGGGGSRGAAGRRGPGSPWRARWCAPSCPARPRRPGSWRGSPSNLTAPPPTGPPGRHGLLEVPCRDYPAASRPAPAGGPLGAPVRSTCAPLPGLRPPTARRAPSRPRPATEQTPRRHPPLVLLRRLRAPPRRTRPVIPGPGPHRATRAPAPTTAPRDFAGSPT